MSPAPLAQFQQAFTRHLLAGDGTPPGPLIAPLACQPGFAVYRNTVLKGCTDALAASYPAVARLVGEAWFRAAALVFVRARPPADGRLLLYGAGFADFLKHFAPARDLPYLPAVARIERHWTESHAAADAPAQDAALLAALPPAALGALALRPHPAARWLWCADAPARTLWECNRPQAGDAPTGEVPWQAEGVLLTRPHAAVQAQPAGRADCVFLDACAQGLPLAQAAQAALGAEPGADLAALLAHLLASGAFTLSSTD